jgi:hypothetical protein
MEARNGSIAGALVVSEVPAEPPPRARQTPPSHNSSATASASSSGSTGLAMCRW